MLAVELDGKPVLADLVGDAAVRADLGARRRSRSTSASTASDASPSGCRRPASSTSSPRRRPGIDDIVVLGKIKQLERSGEWDVIVVDGPAAGHAITFLTRRPALHDAVRGGPVRAQADDVLELLARPGPRQVVLVTLPETTPVNEVVADRLRPRGPRRRAPRAGRRQRRRRRSAAPRVPDPATRRLPRSTRRRALLAGPPTFRRARRPMQDDEIARLRRELALEQWHLPLLPVAGMGAGRRRRAGGVAAGAAGDG